MITIDGRNYDLNADDICKIGHIYLQALFESHLHDMTGYYCDQLNNAEIESARKQIEADESLKDKFLEGVAERLYMDDILDVICEDTILEMDLELDEEDDDDDE